MTTEESIEGLTPLRRRLEAISSAKGRRVMMGTLGLAVEGRAREHTERFRKTGNLGQSIHVAEYDEDSVRVVADADYAPDVEYGTAPHEIVPRRARALRWATSPGGARLTGSPRRGADVAFARRVQHPGTKAQPYMRPAAEEVLGEAGIPAKVIVELWNEADR